MIRPRVLAYAPVRHGSQPESIADLSFARIMKQRGRRQQTQVREGDRKGEPPPRPDDLAGPRSQRAIRPPSGTSGRRHPAAFPSAGPLTPAEWLHQPLGPAAHDSRDRSDWCWEQPDLAEPMACPQGSEPSPEEQQIPFRRRGALRIGNSSWSSKTRGKK